MRLSLKACGCLGALLSSFLFSAATVQARIATDFRLRLRAGDRIPVAAETDAFFAASKISPYTIRSAVIQFDELPTEPVRDALLAKGVRLEAYLPDLAFTAAIPSDMTLADLGGFGVRWVGTLRPNEKLAPILLSSAATPPWCRDSTGLARFTVQMYAHVPLAEAAGWLRQEYGAVILGIAGLAHAVVVGLPAENWSDLAADERVLWIEPFWPRVEHNDSNRANVRANQAQAAPYSLNGSGVMVGEWDGGRADGTHIDFGGRVIAGDGSSIATHATHVAGTVLGSGAASGGTYKGMAPGAVMVSRLWWQSAAELQSTYTDNIQNYDMDVSQNSWGLGLNPPSVSACNDLLGNYFLECGTLDDVVRGALGKPIAICWSAGNERSTGSSYCGSLGFIYGTVTPYGTAKNIITVGAINSNNSTMTSFSSWGPTDDGRIKPEIVAPGCQTNGDYGVTSCRPGNSYTVMCGTSMAAPTMTGCVALWLQRYKALHVDPPLASTVKAAFVESADDLGSTGPGYDYGYGRVNVTSAVDLLNAGRYLEDSLSNMQTRTWTFSNSGLLTQISFTLAWDDVGAADNANPTLVNDLDLRVIPPTGPANYPWKLDPANPSAPAATGPDHVNNLEQVRRTGALAVGTWTVEVTSYNVPQGPQKFSVAYSAGITLTPTYVPYAVQLRAGPDQSSIPTSVPLHFTLSNTGQQNDVYNVTVSSGHGWPVTPSPLTVSVAAGADSILSVTLAIPPATTFGTIDSITGVAVSQANGAVSARDTMTVTVISGRAVGTNAGRDTLGVPGRTILLSARVSNLGIVSDSIDWSIGDDAGWTLAPGSGTVFLAAGRDTALSAAATISGVSPVGLIDHIIVSAISRADATAHVADTMQIRVIDFPPKAQAVALVGRAPTNNPQPTLVWSHVPYSPPPPGFGVFSHTVEIGRDSAVSVGVVRYGPIPDTVLTVPAPLVDGLYFWRVLTRNAVGDSSGFCASAAFEVDTKAPQAPLLLSPVDSAYEADPTPLFAWTPVTGAQSSQAGIVYHLEASTDSLFRTLLDSASVLETQFQIPPANAFPTCSTTVYWRVSARDAAGNVSPSSARFTYRLYRRGDVIFDCVLNVQDVVALVEVAFRNGHPPDPPGRAEINCQPPVDILDVVALVGYVFRGGPPPCGPQ